MVATEEQLSASPVGAANTAVLYGAPIDKLPEDLYIPPDALKILLDQFEGPLDLLLYLIRKQNFNILDIPLAKVTLQFLAYVEQVRLHNLEVAAEYLLMAAMLIQIKSRLLLPQIAPALVEDGGIDPRAELVRKLLEYEQIKAAAAEIATMPVIGRDLFAVEVDVPPATTMALPNVSANDLQRVWSELIHRAKLSKKHHIDREALSVREHMTIILRRLRNEKFVAFQDMFDTSGGIPVVVVHFVAMLELAKETLIDITQAEAFAPIYVRIAASQIENGQPNA